ncbi:MAG: prepilin-type N-terminal cleavage/methylation domain-containing protein [Helicobacter sp.]|nr:prepilin-type N-terminal cleavage/methylation domain-containing protein [Helicobacter sp.]
MASCSKLGAFSTLEILLIIVVLSILATLALPRISFGQQSLCLQKIKHSVQILSSNFAKTQTQDFLLHKAQNPPNMATLAHNISFRQTNCKLWYENKTLQFQAGDKKGSFAFERIAENYQLRCNGDCDGLE